jgi:RNA polymerase sigma-70 factor (ECF subfamily)
MNASFPSTLWTDVVRAKDPVDARRKSALNRLCQAYWSPVYAFLRRKGLGAGEAEDATQGFFAHLLEKELIARADPVLGRFRGFLLACLGHWLANERRVAAAEKRGGGAKPVSIDAARAESELRADLADSETPEAAFHRAWALSVLRGAFDALAREFEERGLPGHFEAVKAHLSAGAERASYEAIAQKLGCAVSDVTNLLHRAKKRLRELIRAALRDTVAEDGDLDGEVADLFRAI